ncbi:DM13 domain-containing protein [Vibrio sp. SS-MA-C1-2]|uniref:DM13 domain-containing protein n=1 Tax=Vibrio sp. SS-MA-C1-2 TaxID=2908646 RepID=UPI001F2A5D44|nr:DM13 domain-containing protein [Vibrio sp. SS-MA-C1-2]UJF17459.1 DM13 domain-containing protein [Vibrio sp. SS-MA-C1-2]
MKKRTIVLLFISHIAVTIIGFAGGIYALPILTAPEAPTEQAVKSAAKDAKYKGNFVKDLQDSDGFHWGEGVVTIDSSVITFKGELAPGPDYKIYLSPDFVETEADFNQLKSTMVKVGDVKTFNNFIVDIPETINPSDYTSVIIWCESFGQFITAAKYQ